MREQISPSNNRRLLLIPIALYLLLCGITLFRRSGWTDEIFTVSALEMPWLSMVRERAARGHPPLFFLLEKLIPVPDNKEWYLVLLRLIPACFGLANVVLAFMIARAVSGFNTALIIATAVAIAPAQQFICHIARSYSMTTFFELLVIYALLAGCAWRINERWRLALIVLAGTMASLSHTSAVVSGGALGVAHFVVFPRAWKVTLAILAGHLIGFSYTALAVGLGNVGHHIAWIQLASVQSFIQFPSTIALGTYWFYLPVLRYIFSGFVVWILLRSLLSNKPYSVISWYVWTVWMLAGSASIIGTNLLYIDRYFAPAGLMVFCLVGGYISDKSFSRTYQLGMATALMAVLAIGTIDYCRRSFYPDWWQMSSLVKSQVQDGEVIIVDMAASFPATNFYFASQTVSRKFGHQIEKWIAQYRSSDEVKGVWLCVESRAVLNDFLTPLQSTFRKSQAYPFSCGVVVHLTD
jgi:hypothetical protein